MHEGLLLISNTTKIKVKHGNDSDEKENLVLQDTELTAAGKIK
jgi:hypothetical protein